MLQVQWWGLIVYLFFLTFFFREAFDFLKTSRRNNARLWRLSLLLIFGGVCGVRSHMAPAASAGGLVLLRHMQEH